jgi:broad specificity phosphatase PhoE
VNVYLIRHAQSEENARIWGERRAVSASDFNAALRSSPASPLTPLGEAQARALVAKLAQAGIEQLYTSPFIRARSTAALSEAFGHTAQVLDELREVLPPPLDETGRAGQLGRLFMRSYLGMLRRRGEAENWADGYRRAQAAWTLLTARPAGAVAAVSHTTLISLLLLVARRDSGWRIRSWDLSNGGVSLVVRA